MVALNIYPNRADYLTDRQHVDAVRTTAFNALVPRIVADLARPNLAFVDGRAVLRDLGGLTTDLLHPADEGHLAMGEHLAQALAPHLAR